MAYKTWLDKDNSVVRLNLIGQWGSGQEFAEAVARMSDLLDGLEQRFVICDLSQGDFQSYSKEFRRSVAETAKEISVDRAAITGASSILRMMAKMLLAAAKMVNKVLPEVKFFHSDSEALAWLKEE